MLTDGSDTCSGVRIDSISSVGTSIWVENSIEYNSEAISATDIYGIYLNGISTTIKNGDSICPPPSS